MAGEPKAKVIISADTAEFNKGIKSAKADMKAFGEASDNVLGKLGSALGVDTSQVEQLSSAIRGMGQKLGQAGAEGSAAFKLLGSGVTKLGAGLAGLGIAGVVAGFKALNSEAENFKSTIAGANIELQTQAYIQTYKQAIHDMYADVGKGAAEAEASWKKFWTTLPNKVASWMAVAPMASATGIAVVGGATQEQLQLQQQINEANQSALDKAGRAEAIAGRLYELERLQSDATREVADIDALIAENRETMRDAQYDLNVRIKAYQDIISDIEKKSNILLPIEKERTELMDEMVSLTQSTPAAIDAANQQYVRQQTLSKQLTDEKASLLRYSNSLFAKEEKTNEALKEQLRLQKEIAQSRADLASLRFLSSPSALSSSATTSAGAGGLIMPEINPMALQEQINAALGGSLFLEVGIHIEKTSLLDLSRQVESVLGSLAESMSSAIGGLVGDLMTGGDAWGNFVDAALSAFGDMAVAVGKIAIEAGIATLGIKAALATLGPAGAAMAIGAGTALVFLGSAVKAGLSNVANGNYSASASVANSGYGTAYGDGFETRELEIKVSGNLVADGNQLKAVINNVDKQNGYTT